MRAREVKAFIDCARVADVMNALWAAGFRKMCVIDSRTLLQTFRANEAGHAPEIEKSATTEIRFELMCDNETETAEAIAIIRTHAKTAQSGSSRIYISGLLSSVEIVS